MPYRVSKAEFARLVELAIEELPPPFAKHLEEITIEIRDRPTERELDGLELEPDSILLGLYKGYPRTQRSVQGDYFLPDVIFIFQDNVQEVSRHEADLVRQVRKTVLHEIGHHFGMSEDDLEELGYG